MNDKQNNGKMINKEKIEAVIAIEEGKKKGLTPFQVGVRMGINNIIQGKTKINKWQKIKKCLWQL